MSDNADRLFGRFTGQSRLKQGRRFLRLTPAPDAGTASSELPLLPRAVELEGSFGLVQGKLVGGTLFEAEVVEVVPPVLSGALDQLIKDGAIDAQALLPEVEKTIRELVGEDKAPSSRGKPLCAVVVGHRESAKGAVSSDRSVTEFDFNSALAKEIEKRVKKARVRIVFRDNRPDGLKRLPGKINQIAPHFILSLHCNAFNRTAQGTETLFFNSSAKGRRLAEIVQKRLLRALELKDRGIKGKNAGDRGGLLLRFTNAPCVICEPFFIDNDADLDRALRRRKSLAQAYARAIDEAAEVFGNPSGG